MRRRAGVMDLTAVGLSVCFRFCPFDSESASAAPAASSHNLSLNDDDRVSKWAKCMHGKICPHVNHHLGICHHIIGISLTKNGACPKGCCLKLRRFFRAPWQEGSLYRVREARACQINQPCSSVIRSPWVYRRQNNVQ